MKYAHGLGDASLFAHVIKMYVDRGHKITVDTDPSKQVLFRAAGAEIGPSPTACSYHHHPHVSGRTHTDHWRGSKVAWNISQYPLPDIGHYGDYWDELLKVKLDLEQYITTERKYVGDYFASLPRPIVLFHPMGNTGGENKNLTREEQADVIHGLLDRTDGTVIVLDWDSRAFWLHSYRCRHMLRDMRDLTTLELYEAMRQADLFIGVDSGPLHFTRFTDTPALGVWSRHHPANFALPRENTLHIVPACHNEHTRYRRLAFHIVEAPGERVSGEAVVAQAVEMLGGEAPQDAVIRNLVGKCRTFGAVLSSYVDRHRSFGMLLEIAKERGLRAWVETGCMRSVEDWTAGMSTYLFGAYLERNGGHLDSVDLDPANVAFARRYCEGLPVTVHLSHSHDWLELRKEPIDVLYLDSMDTDLGGHEENAYNELRLALHLLHDKSLILIDDSPWKGGKFIGKGGFAIPFLLDNGWCCLYSGYQCLLSRSL